MTLHNLENHETTPENLSQGGETISFEETTKILNLRNTSPEQTQNNPDTPQQHQQDEAEISENNFETETTNQKTLNQLQTELQDLENQLQDINTKAKTIMEKAPDSYQKNSAEIQAQQQALHEFIQIKKQEIEEQKEEIKKEDEEVSKAFDELPKGPEGINFSEVQECYEIAFDFLKFQNEEALKILDSEGTYEQMISNFNVSVLLGKDLQWGLQKMSKGGKFSKAMPGFARLSSQTIRENIKEENTRLEGLKNNINNQGIRTFLAEYRNITGKNFSCNEIKEAKPIIEKLNKEKSTFQKIKDWATLKTFLENQEISDAFGRGKNLFLAQQNQIITNIIYETQNSVENDLLKKIPYVGEGLAIANGARNKIINDGIKKREVDKRREGYIDARTDAILDNINPIERIKNRSKYIQLKNRIKKGDFLDEETLMNRLSDRGIDKGIDAGTGESMKKGMKRFVRQTVALSLPKTKNNPHWRVDLVVPGSIIYHNRKDLKKSKESTETEENT